MRKMDYAVISNQGTRKGNEDTVDVLGAGKTLCFYLADGLGGCRNGAAASRLVVDTAERVLCGIEYPTIYMKCVFEEAQKELLKAQKELGEEDSMKTTLVILELYDGKAYIGHIGDSRLYCFEDGKIVFQTKDHSVPQMLARAGRIREDEIRHHPDRNRLLKAMGMDWGEKNYELTERKLVKGQAFLLCTDGFWEEVTEKRMEETLKGAKTVEEWLKKMERTIRKRETKKELDNYSAIGVWIG